MVDRSGFLPGLVPGVGASELPLDLVDAALLAQHPGSEPAADVAAAGNAGKKVDELEQTEAGQSLQHAKVKTGTANSAAGECQTDEAPIARLLLWFLQSLALGFTIDVTVSGGLRQSMPAPA